MNHELTKNLQQKIHDLLDPLIPVGVSCALLDFPHHSNVGDSAIWLGEIEYLRRRKCNIVYTCNCTNYDYHTLKSMIGSGLILLHGGGNFGDLYPVLQRFRETIVESFPFNRIIQFPQSIYYGNGLINPSSVDIFSKHRDFHLFVRDKSSQSFSFSNLGINSYLSPDMALFLNLKKFGKCKKDLDVVGLLRRDKERLGNTLIEMKLQGRYVNIDWMDESAPHYLWLYDWCHKRLRWNSKVPATILCGLATFSANKMAQERLDRGMSILTRGERVVTDRLHAVILSMLAGVSVSYLDNNYGKLSGFIELWFDGFDNINKL